MVHSLVEVSSVVVANAHNPSILNPDWLRAKDVLPGDPLNQRIWELIRLATEDDEQEAMHPKSLEGFCRFLSIHRERIKSRPQLVLTLDGYLRAVWRKGTGRRLALRFIDDKRVAL